MQVELIGEREFEFSKRYPHMKWGTFPFKSMCLILGKAEAVAIWGLLWFSNFLNIPFLHVHGDSKIIIDHVLGKVSIRTPFLQGWMKRIEILWKLLNNFTIQHIGRSQNMQADSLSKKGMLQEPGKWYLEINWENNTYVMEDLLFPGI